MDPLQTHLKADFMEAKIKFRSCKITAWWTSATWWWATPSRHRASSMLRTATRCSRNKTWQTSLAFLQPKTKEASCNTRWPIERYFRIKVAKNQKKETNSSKTTTTQVWSTDSTKAAYKKKAKINLNLITERTLTLKSPQAKPKIKKHKRPKAHQWVWVWGEALWAILPKGGSTWQARPKTKFRPQPSKKGQNLSLQKNQSVSSKANN